MNTIKGWLSNGTSSKSQLKISALILLISLVIIGVIFMNEPQVQRIQAVTSTPQVTVINAMATKQTIPIHTRGKIEAGRQILITSKVSGYITYIDDKLKFNADIHKGDTLLTIDNAYLKMDLLQAEAKLANAELQQQELKANFDAKSHLKNNKALSDLAQGKPHLKAAAANTTAAKQAVIIAQQQLDNSILKAPFSGKIAQPTQLKEHDYLSQGSLIAHLFSSETYKLQLSITAEQYTALGFAAHSNAPVTFTDTSTQETWHGQLVHTASSLSKNHLISVSAAFNRDDERNQGKQDLLIGKMVEATLFSHPIDHIFKLPIDVVRSNNKIWILDQDSRLRIRDIRIIHTGKHFVFISEGLAQHDRVISNHISSAVDGMKLQLSTATDKLLKPSPEQSLQAQ